MRQSSASAARVSCSLLLEPPPETIRLQRVVTNAPGLTVPSFALAELKTGDFSEIRLVEQGQITAMRRSLKAIRAESGLPNYQRERSLATARRPIPHGLLVAREQAALPLTRTGRLCRRPPLR